MSYFTGSTAAAMARRLRRREISARELLEEHLVVIQRENPRVNAIVTLAEDQARARADALDARAARGDFAGPLHGIPIAHKDLEDTQGIRTTYGSPIFANHIPSADSLTVATLTSAGVVCLGKTNTPEFGAGSQTFNEVFGATRNPWDITKTAGGSSGGAAAALATGMVAIADGSDMGGSLRNPAAFCGVCGFRPTNTQPHTLNVHGPMARNVEDLALLFGAMTGASQRLDQDLRGAKIAWFDNCGGIPFDARVKAAVNARRKDFEALGCITETAEPDFGGADEAFRIFRAAWFFARYAELAQKHRARIKATVLEEIDRGARLNASDLERAHALLRSLLANADAFFKRYDFFVLPTTQVLPFDIGQPYVTEIDGTQLESYIDWMRSCYYISILGLPAISIPAGWTADGLPVGLQIVGKRNCDWSVLRLARQL